MQELETKKIPAQTVLSIEHTGAHNDIGKVYGALFAWAAKNKVKPAGPAFTIFLDSPNEIDPASGRFEVCLPVAGTVKGDAKVAVKKLPACTVAAGQVKGPYSLIPAHYTEMLAWLSTQGWSATGAPREVYIKHPDAQGKGDPKEFITEIQFPVDA